MNTTPLKVRAFLTALIVVCLLGIFTAGIAAQSAGDVRNENPAITVISPNGGEIWENGETYTVTWEQENVNMVTIFLQRGSTGYYIVSGHYVDINAEFGSYDFTVPEHIPESDNYEVWIIAYNVGYGQAQDYSDDYFSVKTRMEPISDLYARAKGSKIGLTWMLPAEAVSTNVYRASGEGEFVLIANTMSAYATYLDRNVPPGNYTYMVRWVNENARESSDSNEVSVSRGGRR